MLGNSKAIVVRENKEGGSFPGAGVRKVQVGLVQTAAVSGREMGSKSTGMK